MKPMSEENLRWRIEPYAGKYPCDVCRKITMRRMPLEACPPVPVCSDECEVIEKERLTANEDRELDG